MAGYQSFIADMAALMRRRSADAAKRQSLFAGVSPGNVGNVFDVPPSDVGFANTYGNNAYGTPVRVLDIVGDDALGEMVCISLQQERILDDALGVALGATFFDNVEGPLVGIVEFGAGAGLATFEFDIPSPVLSPGFISIRNPSGSTNFNDALLPWRRVNGTMLSLPASALRVLVRNDANAPYLIQGGGAATGGQPGGAAVSLNAANKGAAKLRVHATYGRRPFPMTLTRTLPVCFNLTSDGSGGPTNAFTVAAGDTSQLDIMIPAYAKRVYLPRAPLEATSVAVSFAQSSMKQAGANQAPNFWGQTVLGLGDIGPLDISPLDTFIRVVNPGPASIRNLSLVFELGI